jgi:oxygen-dependent protoporphyrinogen oxidase
VLFRSAFVRRRLGPAVLDYAVSPFVSGVYAGDPERLSVASALPRLAELEAKHGSLLRGVFAGRPQGSPGDRRPTGRMFSFRDGLGTLPRRLAERIADVRTEVACTGLGRSGDVFRAETSAGPLSARRVVLAVPADVAAALLAELTEGRSRAFAEIPYVPVAVVNAAFRRAEVGHPLDGFGFLAPRKEDLRLLGCLFPSTIFPGRAPEGDAVLTVFAGGRTDPAGAALDDGALLDLVHAELGRALGLRGRPLASRVSRWPRAIPQYELGHGRFVALAAEIEREHPGLHLGGNFLRGISVPDCIRNATALAARIAAAGAS